MPINDQLAALVRPPDWVNPTPAARYNLVVIGGGTAGLVAAAGAAGLGARVALVERDRLGGDCLNTGCVPSKTLISSARARLSFPDAMDRVRRARLALAPHDSAPRFHDLGVDVFFGEARFTAHDVVAVGSDRLRFSRAVIATGARATIPPVPGLAESRPLTNEDVFELTEAPGRMAVVGGGPLGCELAQAFQRLGVSVVLLHDMPRLLDREDADASAAVERALARDGVTIVRGARITRVDLQGGRRVLVYESLDGPGSVNADAILVSAGRTANVDRLDVGAAGVDLAPGGGVRVDDFLRTTNPRIYACGDVCLPWKFTHAADVSARIVVQNALFAAGPLARRRLSTVTMSWCTYTEPEVAHVGRADGDVYVQPFASLDRAVTDGATDGFVKIFTRPGGGQIVGATIVGARAGELVSEVAVAMAGKLSLGALAGVVHPYPTYAEAIRKCGDAYNRTRLTPQVRAFLEWWLRRSR
jgi:pyruvate/2-oxoglutarate dehydrogenase complex dihydrolipoamide dehydrogenase (E3) component